MTKEAEEVLGRAKAVLVGVGLDWPKLEKLVAVAFVDEQIRTLNWMRVRCRPSQTTVRATIKRRVDVLRAMRGGLT